METITKNKLYEGMFLIDSALAGSNWDGVNNTIKTILEKAGAEIVTIKKWDDRKLAYEIKGTGRGTYILCYFRADGGKIKDIENAVKLSEQVIRVLILNAEKMTAEDIEKDTPAARAEKEAHKSPAEQNKDEDEDQSDQDETDEDAEQQDDTDTDADQDDKQDAGQQDASDTDADQEDKQDAGQQDDSNTDADRDEPKQEDAEETSDSEKDSKTRD